MKTHDFYRLLFTPLSPVHIGTGESYEPTNYVIEDGALHEFDTGAVVAALGEGDRMALLAIVSRRPDFGMIKAVQTYFFARRKALIREAVHSIPALDGVARLYLARVGQTANREADGAQVINRLEIDRTAYNRVSRQPILFGSSIKGAIRTALLDLVNGGKPAPESKGLHEFQGRLFRYLNERGRPVLELDPMRLVQISDAEWRNGAALPTARVYLAVNRKKIQVRDERGKLRTSQAEQKQLYQILECVSALHYRAFAGHLTFQVVEGINKPSELPSAELRFDVKQVAQACNAFYRPILINELRLLGERSFVDIEWAKRVESLLQESRLANGSAFLLRVGRHSGAESVTLRGVRKIRIMKGKGQQASTESEARSVWLAASEREQQSNLLPFGWLLAEIAPAAASQFSEWEELKRACEFRVSAKHAGNGAAPAAGGEGSAAKTLGEERWGNALLKFNSKNGTLTATSQKRIEAHAYAPVGAKLVSELPASIQQKLRQGHPVKIVAVVCGRDLLRLEQEG